MVLEEFLTSIDFYITEGSEYLWPCFGNNVHELSSWNRDNNENTVSAIFDTRTKKVYTVEAWDYKNRRTYRWIDSNYIDAVKAEYSRRGIDYTVSIDDEKYIDVDVEQDILEKAAAISAGKDYDTRLQVELNLESEEILQLMTMAHERDITLNQMVEFILMEMIKKHSGKE